MPEPKTGFSFPGPVPREALDYFRAKDLRPGFDYRDVWGSEHAHAFTVAKADPARRPRRHAGRCRGGPSGG